MFVIIALFTILVSAILWYYNLKFKYWESRGVKHRKPVPFFGTNLEILTAQNSIAQKLVEDYNKWPNEKVIGWYRASRPELVLRDPDIIQRILTTDFSYFHVRGFQQNKSVVEPLMKNLFTMDGDLWRLLRQRMTPAFTSGKLKAMFPLIVERAEHLQERLTKAIEHGNTIDARDVMARFTTDFIGACAFGLNFDTLNEENSAFRQLGARIFEITPLLVLRSILKETMPDLCKHVKILGHVEKDVIDLVRHILTKRDYSPSGRNDFIDIMLECKNKGVMTGESIENLVNGIPEKISAELTDELLAAQVFIFFAAGFETSSSATSYTLHQLAFHPEVQQKVQADIDRVLTLYNNKLSYDAVNEMTYLNWTFKESLRILPPVGFLKRECVKPYKIPDINFEIEKGTGVLIPVQALHNDPKYFEEPSVFKPERFSPDHFTENNRKAFLPFGTGPRACIGERLGQMQSLAGLAAVLSKFTVEPAPESLRHPIIDPKSTITQTVLNGLPLQFRLRT